MSFKRKQVDPSHLSPAIRFKWSSQVLEEGVVPLSKMALRTFSWLFKGDNAIEQAQVMLSIIDYRNPKNPWPPTWEFIEFISGLTVADCKAHAKDLEMLGYIKMTAEGERVNFEIQGFLEAVKHACDLSDQGQRPSKQGDPGLFLSEPMHNTQ